MTRFGELLGVLTRGAVDFILVGGVAATAHGSARSTQDIDLLYSREPENLKRLADCLAPHRPYLRGAPEGLPFRLDVATLRAGLNFTLVTDLGWIDLLGEITGVGGYADAKAHAVPVPVFGATCLVIGLDDLIRAKRAAGRAKDLEAVAELEAIRGRARR